MRRTPPRGGGWPLAMFIVLGGAAHLYLHYDTTSLGQMALDALIIACVVVVCAVMVQIFGGVRA